MNKELIHADINRNLSKEPKDLILDGVSMSLEQSVIRPDKETPEIGSSKPALGKGKVINRANSDPNITNEGQKKEEKPKQIVRKKGTIDDIIKEAKSNKELDQIEKKLSEGDRIQFKITAKEKGQRQDNEPVMSIVRKDGNLIYKKDEKEVTPEEFKKIITKGKPEPDLTRISRELLEKEEERRKYNEKIQMEKRTRNEFAFREYEKKGEHVIDYEMEDTMFDGETFYDEAKEHSDEVHKAMTQKDPDR